ncbi:MAG: hypothetical protein Q8R36_03220 [bacterium]|nr:hypothetical protein [bacterium]
MKKRFFLILILVVFIIFVLPFILIETVFKDWFCNEAVRRDDIVEIFEKGGKHYIAYILPVCRDYVK